MDWPMLHSKVQRLVFESRLGLSLTGAVIVLRLLGSLQFLELLALDRLQQLSTRESSDPHIVLIGIDEKYPKTRDNEPLEYTDLAALIETVLAYDPAIVGVDVVEDGLIGDNRARLLALFENNKNLLTVEKVSWPPIPPLEGLSSSVLDEQISFNDIAFDDDGHVRRMFLGRTLEDGTFKSSFPLMLAQRYLAKQDILLTNGVRDTGAMRFGEVEIPRLHPNSGGYRQESGIYGVQTLINFRVGTMRPNQHRPFRLLSASQIMETGFDRQDIAEKIVVIGSIDPNDVVEVDSAVPSQLDYNLHVLKGLELQAHATSQITNAVLNGRPLIWYFPVGWEYVLLIIAGFVSSNIHRSSASTFKRAFLLFSINCLVGLTSYSALVYSGLWLPIVPILLVQTINGVIYITIKYEKGRWLALMQERDQLSALKIERQKTIDQAFDTIHNGPLQTLANLLRLVRDREISQQEIGHELEKLNFEIRSLGESLRQEFISDEDLFVQVGQSKLSLNEPLHELFYEIYLETLKRPFPGFKALKVQARSLEPIDAENLSIECKRKLCLFFEEALCNVGKHAFGATKLTVTGKAIGKIYSLKIIDNGIGFQSGKIPKGRGTKIAYELEAMTKGQFIRKRNSPQGFFCEFQWSLP